MSEEDRQPEESFLSHLIELRDRLIRALLAVGIVFVCLFPWAKELYALLAQPLLAQLPRGGQMIATDVVGAEHHLRVAERPLQRAAGEL